MPGRQSRITSPRKLEATCRRCPDVAARAARPAPQALTTAQPAARTSASVAPVAVAAQCRETQPRATAIAAAKHWEAETGGNAKMNYPAASCGVSKEFELFTVQLLIFRTL